MNRSMKLIFSAAMLFTTLTSQAIAQETIKVGMSGKYFPFTFVKQDQLQGFEVDLWSHIAQRTGYKVEFVTASFSGLFGLLETGRIDTISNQITVTHDRKAKYDFSQPYVYDGAQIVVRKGNHTIHGIQDLAGKSVAVNLGSNFEQLLRKHDPDNKIDIRTYDSAFEQDVALGRIDAFVMDRVSTAQVIKESKLPLQQVGAPFETIENALPFLKTPQQQAILKKVDAALTAMRKDGTLRKISEKWFGSDITDK
ncbi:MAG: amino acid ABC transporter substrate-binding protein [Aeromonas sp.]